MKQKKIFEGMSFSDIYLSSEIQKRFLAHRTTGRDIAVFEVNGINMEYRLKEATAERQVFNESDLVIIWKKGFSVMEDVKFRGLFRTAPNGAAEKGRRVFALKFDGKNKETIAEMINLISKRKDREGMISEEQNFLIIKLGKKTIKLRPNDYLVFQDEFFQKIPFKNFQEKFMKTLSRKNDPRFKSN